MRVLQAHNFYRFRGGEDTGFQMTADLYKREGLDVRCFEKDSRDVGEGVAAKFRAIFSSIYSPDSKREAARLIAEHRPDVLHVHNLFPLLSPSILSAGRDAGIPVVMTCHNYRLVCPIGVSFHAGAVCERCIGGREYWCLLQNCRENMIESAAYALRGAVIRKLGLIANKVDAFIAVSAFVKEWLTRAGLPGDKIHVVYNGAALAERAADAADGAYAAFAGRMSVEKGIDTFLAAARQVAHVPVRLAGGGPLLETLRRSAPANAQFVGEIAPERLPGFLCGARFAVIPSVWNETFGRVAVEAMSCGLPVIASRIGGLQEIVEDGKTGFLVTPGAPGELAERMRQLWENPVLCRSMGQEGRERVRQKFSEGAHFEQLMAVYQHVIGARKAVN